MKRIGRLEIGFWRDTGTPRLRFYWWRAATCRLIIGDRSHTTYLWIFKILSYWTLWIALRRKP